MKMRLPAKEINENTALELLKKEPSVYWNCYGQRYVNLHFGEKTIKAREIVLPMPPSENKRLEIDFQGVKQMLHHVYHNSRATKRGTLRNSTEYNQWLNAAAHLLKKGKYPVIDCKVAILITVVFPDEKRRDPQNREKAFFDALVRSGCVIRDDCLVEFHTMKREIVRGMAFVAAYVLDMESMPDLDVAINKGYLAEIVDRIKADEENNAQYNNDLD